MKHPTIPAELPSPAWFLPHTEPMVLLSRVVGYGDGWITAEVTHRADGPYTASNGATPAWVAIEYMAQTVSAYAGAQRRTRGESPRIGFLLGTREFSIAIAEFDAGSVIQIRATAILESDSEVSIFKCDIVDQNDSVLGTAELKGVQPENPEDFI